LNCRFVGNWPFGQSVAVALDPVRDLAFVGSGGGIYVLDVSVPAFPVKLSEIGTRGLVQGLCYLNNRLYVADVAAGLRIISVSDPAHPVEVGYCDTPGNALGVAVIGDYAYVADGVDGLRVISVTDPAHPAEVGYYDTPGYAYGVAVIGDYAYVAADLYGLRVISVADPANPVEVGFYDTPSQALGVAVSGDYAYVADNTAGLQIYQFYGAGVEEGDKPQVSGLKPQATIVQSVLYLPEATSHKPQAASLLDASGRKVLDLKVGANDVSALAPGVYFVREAQAQAQAQAVRKVIVQR